MFAWRNSVARATCCGVVFLGALICPAYAIDGAKPVDNILPDPNITFGTLPNGLHYVLESNGHPKRGLSLRLLFNVGAFNETADEHGAAHFVEHMAFSGGNNAHEEGPEKDFAAVGVELGRDQNALTYMFSTLYEVDLPSADTAAADLGFRWLRNVADGALFSKDAVDRERQIILAERALQMGPHQSLQQELSALVAPHLRAVRPDFIGTSAGLNRLTPTILQQFYRKWYRPDDATVVVVGDLPQAELKHRVETTFASWVGSGARPMPAPPGSADVDRGAEFRTRVEARLPPAMYICRLTTNDPGNIDTVAAVRERLLNTLWTEIFNRRLANLTKSSSPPFVSAAVVSTDSLRAARQTCLVAIPMLGRWQLALRFLWLEFRRFVQGGVSQDEIDAAVATERANFRGAMHVAPTKTSDALAEEIVQKLSTNEMVAAPGESFRVFDVAAEGVGPKEIARTVAASWAGGGPFVLVSTEEKVATADLKRVWQEMQHSAIAPGDTQERPASWPYTDFGAAGHITKRDLLSNPDFVRLQFGNGVVLNFKHTDFARDQVKIRIRFGDGRQGIPPKDLAAAQLGAGLLGPMGLGRIDYVDIQRLFSQIDWDATLAIEDRAFVLSGSTTRGDSKEQLQIMAAFVSDPGFRQSFDSRIPTLADQYYRTARSEPALVVRHALQNVATNDNVPFPSRKTLLQLRTADFAQLLKAALTTAPLEVTVVGDIEEQVAVEYAAETFGALPPRARASAADYESGFLKLPAEARPIIRVTHQGSTDVAILGAVWPLYVAAPERRREEVCLAILSKVLRNRLRHRLRQELGRTYSPEVQLATPDLADQGYMQALVETAPQDASLVLQEIGAQATRLANGNFSDAEIEAARAPVVQGMTARQQTNDFWVSGLDGSARNPARLTEMTRLLSLFNSVTPEELRKVAATWLARTPLEVIAMPAKSPQQPSALRAIN